MFDLMISRSVLNMGNLGSKTRSLRQNLVHPLETTGFLQSSRNFTTMFDLIISQSESNMGNVGPKTRSLGQISIKPCLSSRGHSFV